MSDEPFTTTDGGQPVASDEHSLTVGPAGPILLDRRRRERQPRHVA
jgi:catalase